VAVSHVPMRPAIQEGDIHLSNGRFCHALATAYAEGAKQSGHDVRVIAVRCGRGGRREQLVDSGVGVGRGDDPICVRQSRSSWWKCIATPLLRVRICLGWASCFLP
jgi:hypothetical protein